VTQTQYNLIFSNDGSLLLQNHYEEILWFLFCLSTAVICQQLCEHISKLMAPTEALCCLLLASRWLVLVNLCNSD
jgi:hypothetical protein